ncbi:hypothetical protein B0A49_12123 [Cryomyces minteri]|uniref:Uncharacterized protein n=1 Tax=Cryomyces minteri TaxID=331657 RepID=A0A4U0VTJ7_9PEZI|nr:hypothetical protein B0A49_12123 [Cryomyces minteri]
MPESRDGLISPAPFVNARYLLAGGLDTPGLVQAAQYEDGPAYADESFRTKWNTASDYSDSFNFDVMQGPLARERNGRRKLPLSPNGAGNETSWGKLVLATTLTLVGGVAHRAWNFVSVTAPFLGFHAGGGQGYFLPPAQAAPEDPPLFQQHQEFDNIYQNATPTPSSYFPFSTSTEDFLGDFEQDNPATPPSSRPAKRQQTDTGWVMVSGEYERDNSPARLSTRKSAIPRPAPTQQQRPQLASRAGSRRSLLPVSRRGSSNTSIGAGSPYSSTALARPHSSQLRHAASFAPTRSPARPPTTTTQIPSLASPALTPEQRLLRQQQRGEKEADASMRKMNKRLRGLIREGKEALGASIEVGGNEWGKDESEVEDEGFFEGAGGGVWRREKSDW